MCARKTPEINQSNGVAALEKINIGGIPQWVMMRGTNRHNPILLFLHGGPGTAQIGFIRRFQTELENHFGVVNWDQRGAGLSYSKGVSMASMTIPQFISDTLELVQWLLDCFGAQRLYLVGHSWGSLLGMLAIQQCPNLFYAYYGVSQLVNAAESDRISYDFTLQCAKETKNHKALKQLEKIGPPPWNNLNHEALHLKWLNRFHGGFYYGKSPIGNMAWNLIFGSEYRLTDSVKLARGRLFNSRCLEIEMRSVDLRVEVPRIEVPVTFCMGKHDYITPAKLANSYMATLEAPQKKWVWFEESAHSPMFEERDKFADLLMKTASVD